MKNTVLSYIWGGLWLVCALFGFLPNPQGALEVFLFIVSLLFFVPPGWLLINALWEKNGTLLLWLRRISGGVLAAAFGLLMASILALAAPSWVGTLLHILLNVLCAPLVSGGHYALSLFLWACVFFTTFLGKIGKNS